MGAVRTPQHGGARPATLSSRPPPTSSFSTASRRPAPAVALRRRNIRRSVPAARSQPWPRSLIRWRGLFGQLGDLIRSKEAGYLMEQEFTTAKAKVLGIGGS
jgi:hypothetical protein